jgi:hypothetical protein
MCEKEDVVAQQEEEEEEEEEEADNCTDPYSLYIKCILYY